MTPAPSAAGLTPPGESVVTPQRALSEHYQECFLRHGRTPRGVDWPNAEDLETRFDVMLDLVAETEGSVSLVDLGCGPGLLLDHLEQRPRPWPIGYLGVDLCEPMLQAARARWPEVRWPRVRFENRDILRDPLPGLSCDYVLMNGLLTERRSIPRDRMAAYAVELLAAAFSAARVGLAFNVMSRLVDWEREDLFHWGFEEMAAAVAPRLSRHMVIRADYGLYEYTVYVFRDPVRPGWGTRR